MSTSYYKLREPFTHLELDPAEQPMTSRLQIWIDHTLSGMLLVPNLRVDDILRLFYDDYNAAVMRTHWDGKDTGAVVTVKEELPDETVVISGYGELMTVAQVKARAGATRKDGMPTELFGYEDAEG